MIRQNLTATAAAILNCFKLLSTLLLLLNSKNSSAASVLTVTTRKRTTSKDIQHTNFRNTNHNYDNTNEGELRPKLILQDYSLSFIKREYPCLVFIL